jgi:hypothetical protein
MTDYRRNFIAGCGVFFERLQDVQQGDGFRKGSTHPTGYRRVGRTWLSSAANADPEQPIAFERVIASWSYVLIERASSSA